MRLKLITTGLTSGFLALPVFAENGLEIIGQPLADGIGFQPAATKLARDLQWLDGLVLIIITAITVFVLGLLAYVILRYNRKANPVPETFTHNSPVEVAWTVIPIVILIFIGAFSYQCFLTSRKFLRVK